MSVWQIIAVIAIIAWAFGKDIRKLLKSGDKLAKFCEWWKNLNPETKKKFFIAIAAIGVVTLCTLNTNLVLYFLMCALVFSILGSFYLLLNCIKN